MTCIRIPNGIITFPDFYELTDENGKTWQFDDHWFCGPTVVKKNGDPTKRQPGERSPFWTAYGKWREGRYPKEDAAMTPMFVKAERAAETKEGAT